MIILYRTNKLAKVFNDPVLLARKFGTKTAKSIIKRMSDFDAVECLEDMKHLPGRCHEMHHDREGQLVIHLDGPNGLFFVPAHDPIPVKEDGGLDWKKVKTIKIIEAEPYHG